MLFQQQLEFPPNLTIQLFLSKADFYVEFTQITLEIIGDIWNVAMVTIWLV